MFLVKHSCTPCIFCGDYFFISLKFPIFETTVVSMLRGLVSSYSILGELFFRRAALRLGMTILKRVLYFFTLGLEAVKVLMIVPETIITECILPLGGRQSKAPLLEWLGFLHFNNSVYVENFLYIRIYG